MMVIPQKELDVELVGSKRMEHCVMIPLPYEEHFLCHPNCSIRNSFPQVIKNDEFDHGLSYMSS